MNYGLSREEEVLLFFFFQKKANLGWINIHMLAEQTELKCQPPNEA